jgi:hypothetical protein
LFLIDVRTYENGVWTLFRAYSDFE